MTDKCSSLFSEYVTDKCSFLFDSLRQINAVFCLIMCVTDKCRFLFDKVCDRYMQFYFQQSVWLINAVFSLISV